MRTSPPTLDELWADEQRQARIKVLAAEADKRWRSIPLKQEALTGSADEDPRLASAWGEGAVEPAQTRLAHDADTSAQALPQHQTEEQARALLVGKKVEEQVREDIAWQKKKNARV